jgi:predicted cobalt transporter CbtA
MGLTDLLRRGLAAGAAAGLAAAIVLFLLVEPVIRRALVIEDGRGAVAAAKEAAAGHAHSHGGDEEPLVSRTVQVIGGMGTAIVIGILFGIAFAIVFALTRHRLPAATDHGRALVLAGLGFLTFVLLPALKIPSNPPAVGDPETVNRRTLIWVLTILVSVAIVLAVFVLDTAFAAQGLPVAARGSLGAVVFAVLAIVMLAILPGTPDRIPGDVPAALIWDFRLASLAQLAALWATLGLVFGLLVSPRVKATSETLSERDVVAA